jgi:hypothetical protein
VNDTTTDPPADEPLTFPASGEFLDARRFIGLLRDLASAPLDGEIVEIARGVGARFAIEHPAVANSLGDPAQLAESMLKLFATLIGETLRQVAQLAELSRVTVRPRLGGGVVRELVVACIPTIVPDEPGYADTRIQPDPGQPVSGERADTKHATIDRGDKT